jgi:mannose-1-phosphate guanylyltransferase
MKAIILTGGLGTRLRPFTIETPKPLLPVLNEPFLNYQLRNLKQHGVDEVILATAYRPEKFKKVLGTGSKLGLKIRYVHEKTPLGTGGAVRNAFQYLTDTTLILNGDVLHSLDVPGFIKQHRKSKAEVSITLVSVKDPTRFGLVETGKDGRIENFLEKPSWDEVSCDTINAGAYLFELSAIQSIATGGPASLGRDLFPQLLDQNRRLFGFKSQEYWLDFGTVEKYLQIHLDILNGSTPFLPTNLRRSVSFLLDKGAKISKSTVHEGAGSVVIGRSTKSGERVRYIGQVCIGKQCIIEDGATLENCVILDGTRVGAGARISGAIIGEKCKIGKKSIIRPGRALGDHSVIKEYSSL